MLWIFPDLCWKGLGCLEQLRNIQKLKNQERTPETPKKTHVGDLLHPLLSVLLLEVQQLVCAITVMSHFRHSWCIEISCLLGRFSLDASKGTWRMMWRQDSSSCFWNLSVWMSKHAQVAQLVGYVSENAAYHHGEMSLVLPSSICVLKGSPGWILKAKHMRLKVMDVMMSLTNASIFPVSTDLILVCWHLGRML